MNETSETMTDVLRKTIAESGMAYISLERATGVKRASIMRFVRGTTSLRLNVADRLAVYFGLVLRPDQRPSYNPSRRKADS